ncbi:ABC transporter ATP-binding protein [Prosthecomicrobium sp. N25]|uniref:ABC transporter ATP-binding protein n=1 Tax=Prosthecomicrobium sp. N25 TaxID=3129254 RepID=UPI003076ED2F
MALAGDILRIENLGLAFSFFGVDHVAVRDASLRVLPGKVTALVGESGSGKSVIAQTVMGILPNVGRITKGRILFSDPERPGDPPVDIAALDRDSEAFRRLRGTRISIIFQEPMTSLSPLHTIGDQIGEVLTAHDKATAEEARAETVRMLGLVGFPDPERAYGMYPFELSGGLRQRAMIAMALICRPAILIADEPTTALDVTIQAQILQLLKSLQAQLGLSILLITHDLGVVANIADEVFVIYKGEIMEAGTVRDLFGRPSHPYFKALLSSVPHFDMPPGVRLTSLRNVKADLSMLRRPRQGERGSPHLTVENLVKTYRLRGSGWTRGEERAVRAVDGVSFEIRRGECLGLVGESGCGKSTVSKLIMRAVTPDEGSILFHEPEGGIVDIARIGHGGLQALRPRIQMVFQDPYSSLSPRMTVERILTEPLEIHGHGTGESRRETARALMRAVGLDPRMLSRYPHSFSGGQRQRIGIARALALGPELIICDEPVSALDVSVQAQILNLLQDLRSELGLTYLFISHNLAVVDYMADRVAVMCRGRIVEIATSESILRNPVHPYTRALLAAVPYPDLDRPLDFDTLLRTGASDSRHWPPAFQEGPERLELRSVGEDHQVLVRPNAAVEEIVTC